MAEQRSLKFTQNTIQNINIYREAPLSESKTSGTQVKLTPSQLEAVKSICREHGMDASTFLRDALDFWVDLFPYRAKLENHHRFIRAMLDRLS